MERTSDKIFIKELTYLNEKLKKKERWSKAHQINEIICGISATSKIESFNAQIKFKLSMSSLESSDGFSGNGSQGLMKAKRKIPLKKLSKEKV